ncbi:MAG: hypothetical protein WBD02_11320, partial [Acidimicrobiia bacterium]
LSQNRYGYGEGDPVNHSDPSGHDAVEAGGSTGQLNDFYFAVDTVQRKDAYLGLVAPGAPDVHASEDVYVAQVQALEWYQAVGVDIMWRLFYVNNGGWEAYLSHQDEIYASISKGIAEDDVYWGLRWIAANTKTPTKTTTTHKPGTAPRSNRDIETNRLRRPTNASNCSKYDHSKLKHTYGKRLANPNGTIAMCDYKGSYLGVFDPDSACHAKCAGFVPGSIGDLDNASITELFKEEIFADLLESTVTLCPLMMCISIALPGDPPDNPWGPDEMDAFAGSTLVPWSHPTDITWCGSSSKGKPIYCVSAGRLPSAQAAGAVTFGHYVFCNGPCKSSFPEDDAASMQHEMVHVRQWEDHGDDFGLKYLAAAISGYCPNEYEQEAYKTAGKCR